jgi:ferrous iron transport protein B
MSGHRHHDAHVHNIALLGNPNSGKTTLFNALTGLHHKVGNYPGVTVERKEGLCSLAKGHSAVVLDLPGTYSLHPASPDEKIAADALLGHLDTPPPDVVVCVADATNLERNLYLVTQVMDCGLPAVVALTMFDLAEAQHTHIDIHALSTSLGVPVIPVVANEGSGIDDLRKAIMSLPSVRHGHKHHHEHHHHAHHGGHHGAERVHHEGQYRNLPEPLTRALDRIAGLLHDEYGASRLTAAYESNSLLLNAQAPLTRIPRADQRLRQVVASEHERLSFLGIDPATTLVESRYDWIRNACMSAIVATDSAGPGFTDRIDRIVTHKVWGFLLFIAVMAIVFQSIFTWAAVPMAWIGNGFDSLERFLTATLPPGDLRSLLVDGALAGVAGVVTFLPQIAFLFFFLGVLEDSGYMARAAFIMDKLMSKVGLHGKSFIPLLGSFACAVPGIMATRTIENPKDRLATILVAPLMSCSARLPVYSLLIAACIPATSVLGIISYQGLTLLSLYLGGMIIALAMAWLFKKTLLRGHPPLFIMELPPYKVPSMRTVLFLVWERVQAFLKTAGTIILGVSILLWFLVTYPKADNVTPAKHLEQSYAGRIGTALEPAIRPLGFDWKIGIGLVSSMLQREAFVSAMATIYNVPDDDTQSHFDLLRQAMRGDINANTGQPTFGLATTLALLAYYLVALQCLSTVAVVRRETNSWKWPVFQFVYMFILAYAMSFLVYRGVLLLGGHA